uniref:Uncharacterized protein n=1 Tax=Myoviridae sp. ctkfK18 TaxID=2825165 RepID=A0A8S5VGC0_9CAUD|nr:MAG TPA: hypothetical protein [Myoviridae sp. ctkfK18]
MLTSFDILPNVGLRAHNGIFLPKNLNSLSNNHLLKSTKITIIFTKRRLK